MYLGKMAEKASRAAMFEGAWHPYTQALLSAVPRTQPGSKRTRVILEGDVPSPINPPTGCRFHTRCPLAYDRCSREEPKGHVVGVDHEVTCHLYEDRTERLDLIEAMAAKS